MSLSKECQEYHLTPKGWIVGSFMGDVLGGSNKLPNPSDRVLTIACYDETTSVYSKPSYYDNIIWESEDKKEVASLKTKWGAKPDWFGYEKINENKDA